MLDDLLARAADASRVHAERYPGDHGGRQPVHTVYVPADRFDAGTVAAFGLQARRLLDHHATGPGELGDAFGITDGQLAATVHERVTSKLAREPVEDVRIDFEDGYGRRDGKDEDADADRAAAAVADAFDAGTLPPFYGLRVKSFADGQAERSLATLERFLMTLLKQAGALPPGFAVTFPKILAPAHVEVFAQALARLESNLGLSERTLRMEVQIETAESVIDGYGAVVPPKLVDAAGGRLTGAAFGVFDYTAALGLPPVEQRLDHPACDFARHVMQVGFAGTGVRLSDGATNAVPSADSRDEVRRVWQLHARHVRHSLAHGYWQGWDLHPAHLVSRYATVYAFHLGGLAELCERLRGWFSGGQDGPVLDEPATVQALLAGLRRAVACGAVSADEALQRTGLHADQLG